MLFLIEVSGAFVAIYSRYLAFGVRKKDYPRSSSFRRTEDQVNEVLVRIRFDLTWGELKA